MLKRMNTPSISSGASQPSGTYVPGVCNINQEEVAYRRRAGYIGVVTFAIIAAILLFVGSRWARLVLGIPAFIAAIGFLQAQSKFCVSYGAAGKQNATDGDKVVQDIVDAAARKLDKRRARTINLQAAGIALLITGVMLLIP